MDMSFSESDLAFRKDVREFINEHFPPEASYDGTKTHEHKWAAALATRGWSSPKWPIEHGGTGWSATQNYIWERETHGAGVPSRIGGMGMMMLAPILYTYGTEEQARCHLPGIAANKVEWCQGYSEPGAGSDLAQVRTSATRDGNDYIINGEKVWTSWAHIAHWIFALVRTDTESKPQQGITFLLIDMSSPGVSVYPIPSIDGKHSLNRVTFDDVRVPVENRIGEENMGWTYAKGVLTHERTGLAMVSESIALVGKLKRIAKDTLSPEFGTLAKDPAFSTKIADISTDLTALEYTELRALSETARGEAPGSFSSILKLKGTLVFQRITELFIECAGIYIGPFPEDSEAANDFAPGPEWALPELRRYLSGRSASIAGGTDQVQRNIITKHILGLG